MRAKLVHLKGLFKPNQSQGKGDTFPIHSTNYPPIEQNSGGKSYGANQAYTQSPHKKPPIDEKGIQSLNQYNDHSSTAYQLDTSTQTDNSNIHLDRSTHYHIENLTICSDERIDIFLNGLGIGLTIGSIVIFIAWLLLAFR